jgi:DinB superfamily
MASIPLICVLLISTAFPSFSQPLGTEERKLIVELANSSRKSFESEARDLVPAQLAYKPVASAWTILQLIEHQALLDRAVLGIVQGLGTGTLAGDSPGNLLADDAITSAFSTLGKPYPLLTGTEPNGSLGDDRKPFRAFVEARKALLEYLKETKDPLRSGRSQGPVGKLDAYQWVIYLSAATERNARELKGFKSLKNFPKAIVRPETFNPYGG